MFFSTFQRAVGIHSFSFEKKINWQVGLAIFRMVGLVCTKNVIAVYDRQCVVTVGWQLNTASS